MKILITGATGLVGKQLVTRLLEQGYEIHYLSTSRDKLKSDSRLKGFYWNIETKEIDVECFNGVEKIIHLAGARVAHRWTEKYKLEIIESRVKSAELLHEALCKIKHNVTHFISASGVSVYKSSTTELYKETDDLYDQGFLGNVVKQWEIKANDFKELGIAVAIIRIGVVFAKNDSAIQKMANPIAYGGGAIFGNGKQYISWIHISDLVSVFNYVVTNNLIGIYNAVAPEPKTNKEITKALAKKIKRPLLLPNIPRVFMKAILGEMHHLLFDSQKVSSRKIINSGFSFKYPTLDVALEDLF